MRAVIRRMRFKREILPISQLLSSSCVDPYEGRWLIFLGS